MRFIPSFVVWGVPSLYINIRWFGGKNSGGSTCIRKKTDAGIA